VKKITLQQLEMETITAAVLWSLWWSTMPEISSLELWHAKYQLMPLSCRILPGVPW